MRPPAAVLLLLAGLSPLRVHTANQQNPEHKLSFAETVYINFSGACRAMMDLRYNSLKDKNPMISTMKIVYLDGNSVQKYPIDEAYVTLTKKSMFDITKQTKIVIHGYKDSAQSAIPYDLASAYNEKGMFNVLMVDAEELVQNWYLLSVHNARLVGKRLANLLANLEDFGAAAEDFHVLGVSLGAHIAGWAGKYFLQYKGKHLGRITGLDPAGPCFSYAYSDQRLDKTDATYVDVVHSNRLVQGVIEPLGHADFYLNGGGPHQPGCMTPTCSHLRAAQVYTESVRSPKAFVGVKCNDWKEFTASACSDQNYAVLGYGSSTTTRGLYYLRTATRAPFGLGMNGTQYQSHVMDDFMKVLHLNYT